MKGKVQSVPVLVFPDFDKPFLLEMDASMEGLGVVLSQKQSDRWYHPIAFGSHFLTLSEFQAGVPCIEMEHDRAFQRVPHVCAFCGANR